MNYELSIMMNYLEIILYDAYYIIIQKYDAF